jgi:cell division protein FtsZ
MIQYNRDPQQTIPTSAVKIIGLGGAGANMLERIALDGLDGAELLALNTDIRTLAACLAREKIQLGVNLTKGLGAGGDPELGHQAMLESEDQIRASIKGRRIVFLCTGLGGGTGSGAAPIVTRIAREEGAFVVVFATMPFAFEGRRRRDQAETALNELAVLSNALVTFDNNRMGELVLAKQGIHEAFAAADHMICESIKAVIRLVIRPGLINIGLDDLMSALRTNRSRCLFGSGIANGKDRAIKALRNALNSPLLDQGTLLKDAQTVLVHLSGGEDLTLFEIELLMQRLQKFVPEKAHVLFGAAIDPAMGDSLSITLISALPEDSLAMAPRESLSRSSPENPILDPSQGFTAPVQKAPEWAAKPEPEPEPEPEKAPEPPAAAAPAPPPQDAVDSALPLNLNPTPKPAPFEATPVSSLAKFCRAATSLAAEAVPSLFDDDRPFAEPEVVAKAKAKTEEPAQPDLDAFTFTEPAATAAEPEFIAAEAVPATAAAEEFVAAEEISTEPAAPAAEYVAAEEDPEPIEAVEPEPSSRTGFTPLPKRKPLVTRWGAPKVVEPAESPEEIADGPPVASPAAPADPEPPKLKLGVKPTGSQNQLSLDSAPRGRFEGETPNVFDGEDLDLPPFLRKKK